jgi:hypothetical protein
MVFIGQQSKSLRQSLWDFFCSLKLAIVLASTVTLLTMAGSLIMHFNPEIFASMEQEIMSRWLPQAWRRAPLLVSWVPLTSLTAHTATSRTYTLFQPGEKTFFRLRVQQVAAVPR